MSTQDADANEQAQREALQHNLAYLDVLPQDQEESMGDTDAALNSLFEDGNLQQYDDMAGETEAAEKGQEMDDMPVGEAAAEAERREGDDMELPEIAPSDSVGKPADAEGAPEPTPKRKATSRANMLARGGACEYCKRRKLKCSAEKPRCDHCARSDRECVYAQKQQKSRVRVLEDRLAELEKKLSGEAGASGSPANQPDSAGVGETYPESVYAAISSAAAAGAGPSGTSAFVSPLGNPGGVEADDTFQYSDVGLAGGMDLGFTLDILGGKEMEVEPDLMTLADAATHDRIQAGGKYPWDGMSAEKITAEILSAVSGAKGPGEKIVLFLLQSYISPRNPQTNLLLLDPSSLLPRLSPRSSSPLHPSLILSIIILVISFLPPSAFSSTSTPQTIASALLGPARFFSAQAYATADPRLLDTVAAQALRGIAFFNQGRFLDGWVETSGSAALAWACGLGKLGGVGQRFLSESERGEGWERRCEEEARAREWRFKGQVAEPPKTRKEYGERVRLFWGIYLLDKGAAVGWGWPSSFNDDEITTPWPSESCDKPEDLRKTSSLADFLASQSPSGRGDTTFSSLLKAFTLLYRATRLFDTKTSPQETQDLLRVAELYMADLKPVELQSSAEWGVQQGPVNSNWMIIHAAMSLLHAKASMNSPTQTRHLTLCIASCQNVVDCVELAREMGDFAFGYDITGATVWAIVARTAYKAAERIGRDGQGGSGTGGAGLRVEDVRRIGDKLVEALRVMGKRIPYAATCAQVLENTSLGSEVKVGEWVRPDWTNP